MYEEIGGNQRTLITLGGGLTEEDLDSIRSALSGLPETSLEKYDGATVTIEHYPGIVSSQMVVDTVTEAGYSPQKADPLGPVGRRLKRMADSSQATFGSGRLDCCNLGDD